MQQTLQPRVDPASEVGRPGDVEELDEDAAATALVAAIITIYLACLAFDGTPFVRDPEGIAGVGLILGFASRRISGRAAFALQRLACAAGLGEPPQTIG